MWSFFSQGAFFRHRTRVLMMSHNSFLRSEQLQSNDGYISETRNLLIQLLFDKIEEIHFN